MFQLVCDAVAGAGNSLGSAAIFLKVAGSDLLKLTAAAGQGVEGIEKMEISVDPNHPRGNGLAGPTFREQKLMIAHDLATDQRTRSVVQDVHQPYGAATVPLVLRGESIGVIYFFFARTSGDNDDDIQQLMCDIGANISFALEVYDKEAHKERVSRMLGGAQRHQRGHHAREIARRALRNGLRGGLAGREVHLDVDPAGRTRRRGFHAGRVSGTQRSDCADAALFHVRKACPGPRADRKRLPERQTLYPERSAGFRFGHGVERQQARGLCRDRAPARRCHCSARAASSA